MRNQNTTKNPLLMMSKIFMIVMIGHLSQVFLQAQDPPAQVKRIDENATYRLSNDYSGPKRFLTISENGVDLEMAEATRASKQIWKFDYLGEGFYKIVSLSDISQSLEVDDSGSNPFDVGMAEVDDVTSQSWGLLSLSDGKFRVINMFTWRNKSLDVQKNGDAFSVVVSESGNYTGQVWTLTKVKN